MGSAEKLCLKWDDFQTNISSSLGHMRKDEDFADVTLTCDGDQKIEAHKVILAASSVFFSKVLKRDKHPHPLLYMKGMNGNQLNAVVDFIYNGEVNIFEENIEEFLLLAEELQLKGLNNSEPGTPTPETRLSKIKQTKHKVQILTETATDYDDDKENSTVRSAPRLEETAVVPVNTNMKTQANNEELDETINSMLERLETGEHACKVCGKIEAKNVSHIRNHIEAKHIEGMSHSCSQCGKLFRSRNSLGNHVSLYHKTK